MTFGLWTLLSGSILGLAMLGILMYEMRDQRRERKRMYEQNKGSKKVNGYGKK